MLVLNDYYSSSNYMCINYFIRSSALLVSRGGVHLRKSKHYSHSPNINGSRDRDEAKSSRICCHRHRTTTTISGSWRVESESSGQSPWGPSRPTRTVPDTYLVQCIIAFLLCTNSVAIIFYDIYLHVVLNISNFPYKARSSATVSSSCKRFQCLCNCNRPAINSWLLWVKYVALLPLIFPTCFCTGFSYARCQCSRHIQFSRIF